MFNPKEHMMSLKGKDYLQVMWRIVWLRDEHPDYQIKTELLHADAEGAVFKAEIANADGFVLAAGHGSETKRDFGDFLEKAETKAVGRACAMLGYGTQFAPELDEGERIVDSPVETKQKKADAPAEPKPQKNDNLLFVCAECGEVLKPYKDVNGKEVSVRKHAVGSEAKFGKILCIDCVQKKLNEKSE